MKKLLFFLILSLILSQIIFSFRNCFADPTLEAVRKVNGNAGASDYCMDAVSSSDGGLITAGYSSDNLTSYATLIKYNSSGSTQWLRTFREKVNGSYSYSRIITDSEDNIFVAGGILDEVTGYDILVQKYSPDGVVIWTKKINSSSNNSDAISEFKQDHSGDLLILFNEQGDNPHINLAKLNNSGNILWQFRYTDTLSTATSFSIDSLNNIYISGSRVYQVYSTLALLIKLDGNGNRIWTKNGDMGDERELNFKNVVTGNNNEIYVLGDKNEDPNQFMRLQKIDSGGNSLWSRDIKLNIKGQMNSKTLGLDNTGNLYYSGSLIPFVIDNPGEYIPGYILGKYNPSGDSIWSRVIINGDIYSGDDIFVKINGSNEVNVLCYMRDPKTIGKILKFSSSGDSLSSGDFNNTGYGRITSLSLDINGDPVGCGTIFRKLNSYDQLVKSYNSTCVTKWEGTYDSKGFSDDASGSVSEDSEGNIYVTGYNSRQAILIKYNEAMTEQWKYIVSDSIGYYPYYYFEPMIAIDNSDNVYFTSIIKSDSTEPDINISKLDPSGNMLFSITIAGPGDNSALLGAINTDPSGNLYVSGSTNTGFLNKYSPSGNLIWSSNNSEAWGFRKIEFRNEIVCCIGGSSRIALYESSGILMWYRSYQPNNYVHVFYDLKFDNSDNIVVCGGGTFEDQSQNYIILKYNINGDMIWNKNYNGQRNSDDYATSLVIDSLNNIVVAGTAREFSSNFGESLTLLKLDPEGDQIWKKIISDPSGARLSSGVLRKDEFDNVYISSGKNSYKNSSFLLIKYRSNGDSVWSSVYKDPVYNNSSSDFILTENNGIIMTGITYGENTGFDITALKYSQTVGIFTGNTDIVLDYSLGQNYPNPFNPTTTIEFGISSDAGGLAHVSLKVYNALGAEVAVLVNENKPAGKYSVQFNGANYPSGIYYYKLSATGGAGNFSEVRKMIILK